MTNTVRISNQQGCGLTCDHQVGGVAPVQMQGHQGPRTGELDVHFQFLPVAQHLQLCMLSRKLLGRQEIERDPLPLPAGGRGMRTAPAGPVMAGSSGTSWDSDSLPFCISYLLLPKMLGNQSSSCHALGKKAGKSKLAVESPSKLLCAVLLIGARADSYMAVVREDNSHDRTAQCSKIGSRPKGVSSCFGWKLTSNHPHEMLSDENLLDERLPGHTAGDVESHHDLVYRA